MNGHPQSQAPAQLTVQMRLQRLPGIRQIAPLFLMALLLVCTLFASAVQAAPLNAADEKSVRSVVEGQLAAFASDDAAKAYSFAAPNVREATGGSAANFMRMVREGYPVVYRPASVAFLKPEGQAGEAVQRVQLQDAKGESWLAVYTLQRQKDKSWRISGCVVLENKGRMA